MKPPSSADGHRGERPHDDLADQALAAAGPSGGRARSAAPWRRRRAGARRRGGSGRCSRRRRVAQQVEDVGAQEGGRDGAEDHPADQRVVDRLLGHVHDGAHRAHEHRRHQVARDGGRGLDPEEEDQHRRHQRAAAGAGHADQEADHGAPEDDVGINRHGGSSALGGAGPRRARQAMDQSELIVPMDQVRLSRSMALASDVRPVRSARVRPAARGRGASPRRRPARAGRAG